jgi:cyclopropane fatty-acyl-phospholipid synthase-like methyltransferase
MNSKEYFLEQVIGEAAKGTDTPIRVLELGCGRAPYIPTIINKYPNLEYVGVEPIDTSFEGAELNLETTPRTKIVAQLGYGDIEGLEEGSFDVVVSLSVLEHVKHLDKFMDVSARYLKKGGVMVHRYDLGHALTPMSLKEHVHVWLGNHIPSVLPERKFVRYVPMKEVEDLYRERGVTPYRHTYHQMPNHKSLVKELEKKNIADAVMEEVYVWEFTHAEKFAQLDLPIREKLFPAVAVWGKKE